MVRWFEVGGMVNGHGRGLQQWRRVRKTNFLGEFWREIED
jgi:hypothetical protein